MAHNSYIRAGAIWALNSVLLSAEAALFDVAQFKSINGDDGGTWAPGAAIIIGGVFGLRVTGPLLASDADITITNTKFLSILGGATFHAYGGSTVTIDTTLTTFTGGSITHFLGTGGGAHMFIDDGATFAMNGVGSMASTGTLITAVSSAITANGTINIGDGLLAGHGIFAALNHSTSTWQSGATATFSGGSTVNLAGTVNTSAAFNFAGTSVVTADNGSTMSLTSAITIPTFGSLTFTGTAQCTIGSSAGLTCVGTLTVSGTLNCQGGSTITLAGTTTISGPVTISGATTITGTVTHSGVDAYVNIRSVLGNTVDDSYDAREFDFLEVPTLPGAVHYTFINLGANDRVLVHVNRFNPSSAPFTGTVFLDRADASNIDNSITGGNAGATAIFWNGSIWLKHVTG